MCAFAAAALAPTQLTTTDVLSVPNDCDVDSSLVRSNSESLPPAVLPSASTDLPQDSQALHDRTEILTLDGKYAEARPLYEQLVAMAEAEHGPDDPKVGNALNDLAHVLYALGDYPLARSTAERALKINEAALGSNHLDVARNLFQLARVLQRQNELDAAQSLLERALAIQEATLGPNHTVVATSGWLGPRAAS